MLSKPLFLIMPLFVIASLYAAGEAGLPDDTIHVKFNGHAGQSFGFCLAKGVHLEVCAVLSFSELHDSLHVSLVA